jgi:hypothetical protein
MPLGARANVLREPDGNAHLREVLAGKKLNSDPTDCGDLAIELVKRIEVTETTHSPRDRPPRKILRGERTK